LHPGRTGREHQHRGDLGDRPSPPVRHQLPRHAEQGVADDNDGHQFQAVHRGDAQSLVQPRRPSREGEQQQRRGQGEGEDGRQRSGPAGTQETDGETHLAAGRPREQLADRQQLRELRLVEPAATMHEVVAEMAEMGDRAAKGSQPESQESAKNLGDAPRGRSRIAQPRLRSHWSMAGGTSRWARPDT
jgi:hypothetical protein